MEDDIKLYKEFISGNNDAFNKIMVKYKDNLIYFIQKYTGSIAIAEELA